MQTQALCFKLYFLEEGGEESVEGKFRVKKDYACCQWKNIIKHCTPDRYGQEKIFQEGSKGRG